MLGALLQLALPAFDHESIPDDEAWRQAGLTIDGKDIWERTFPGQGQQPEFLVTILFDANAERSQLLYATRLSTGNRIPRLPTEVRSQAEAFGRRLAAHTAG